MSWLRSLIGVADPRTGSNPSAERSVLFLGDESFDFEIVGESKCQEWLGAIAGPKCEEGCEKVVPVELRPEPDNAYDANAVQVLILGGLVGYIPRPAAAVIAPLLEKRGVPPRKAEVVGMVVGGWDRAGSEGSYGVKLDLLWPPEAHDRPS